MSKITAHTLVKNESRFVWYSLMSVLPFVDEIIVGNHGSTDNTIEIIKSIKSPKIKIYDYSHIPNEKYSEVRNAMMQKTQTDWLLILDGDEIWPYAAIQNTVKIIQTHPDLDFIIQPYFNLVGDVYHYLPDKLGKYQIFEYRGHVTFRALNINKIGNLNFCGEHMKQGIFDQAGTLIQDRANTKYIYQPIKYLHATHLRRSHDDQRVQKRVSKYKYELGNRFGDDFSYPEVFYHPHLPLIADIWEKRSYRYEFVALLQHPFKMLKRALYESK